MIVIENKRTTLREAWEEAVEFLNKDLRFHEASAALEQEVIKMKPLSINEPYPIQVGLRPW